jgi:hypothetical protein
MPNMLKINERPYVLLYLTAIALFIVRVLAPLLNIEFKGTMSFGVPSASLGWIIPVLLTIFWFIYLLTTRFLYSRTISWIHVLLTVTSTILILIIFLTGINPNKIESVDRVDLIGNAMQILFLIFVFSQILFLANILIGFLKRQK